MTANKPQIKISILILTLVLFLSTIAYAKPFTDAFSGGLVQINNFFSGEQYKPYAKALDFFFFSLLFIAIYMMGARYAFKEVKRPETVIVILLGLMTGFLMVLGGWSATALLPYLHWLLYTLLFILYWWLLKGIKNKFWRFVLALLLTLLTIGLLQGLFDQFTAPDTEGFFRSFGKSFKGISLPGISFPGIPDYFQNMFGFGGVGVPTGPSLTTLPPAPSPTPVPRDEGGFLDSLKNWWWVPLLLLLPLAYWGWRKRKPKGEEKKEEEPKEPKKEDDIDDLLKEVTEALKKKMEVLKKINTIMKTKEKNKHDIHNFVDLYHKKIYDDAFYLDREHEAFKALMAEHRTVSGLLELERELEKDLLELMKLEEELIGKSQLPLGNWEREKFTGRLVEVLSIPKQKEWYGRVFIWYWYVKRLQKHIENEYTARLVQDKEITPELAVPKGIPDFYGRIFGGLDKAFGELRADNQSLLSRIKQQIVRYFVWTKDEERIATEIKLLSDAKELEKWLKKGWATRWHDIKDKKGQRLVKIFENEKKMFLGSKAEPGLFRNLLKQLALLQYIKAALEALKSAKASMTQLQDLNVSRQEAEPHALTPHAATPHAVTPGSWTDVTKDAKKQPGIPFGPVYSVHTRIQEGIGPFLVRCLVNGKVVTVLNQKPDGTPIRSDWYEVDPANKWSIIKDAEGKPVIAAMIPMTKPVEKKHDEVRFTFEEIGINAPGIYDVTFVCISIAEKVYERKDVKKIKIYLEAGLPHAVTPHATTPHALTPHAVTPQFLTLSITSPASGSTYYIGNFINGLAAEVVSGPQKDEINAESLPNVKFVWYIEQLEGYEISDAKPIPDEAISDGIFKFAAGQDSMEVSLMVFLIDANRGIIASARIPIVIKPSATPHAVTPHAVTPELLTINIISPPSGMDYKIGDFINGLAAEVVSGPQKDEINAESLPNVKFVWYIEQLEGYEISDAKPIQRRIGNADEAISDGIFKFAAGQDTMDVWLTVLLVKPNERMIIAAAARKIFILSQAAVPHATTPVGPHALTPPVPTQPASPAIQPSLTNVHGQISYLDQVLSQARRNQSQTRIQTNGRAKRILKSMAAVSRKIKPKNAKRYFRR
ncbi:hypothetical protein HYX08_00715 [Candidatus Woesearchaeota archaeon]|nr:hypothetical protein [Candidatus Woesearchaeota archaeon]